MRSSFRRFLLPAAALALVTGVAVVASRADDKTPAPTQASAAKTFATPEEAAKALFQAMEANDDAALRSLVGPGSEDLAQDGKDPVVQKERTEMAAAAKTKLAIEKQADGSAILVIGSMEYPLAVPLVQGNGAWRFDAEAGRKELLARRIGEQEMEAIGICLAYVDAQVVYAQKDRNGDGVREFAQKILSTPGQKDGLYWDSADGEEASPAGPELTPFKEALASGSAKKAPFNGYYWRILSAQGPHAAGGAFSYVINGRMLAGFALLAAPAVYRNTGVMSFLVSNQGKVYEKDLGPDTLTVAGAIDAFDPDGTWREVDEKTLQAAEGTLPADAPFAEGGAQQVGATSSKGPAGSMGTAAQATPGLTPATSPAAGAPCPRK